MSNGLDFSDVLMLSPPSQYLNLKAGETYEGSITIASPASLNKEMEYYVGISPYGVNANDYSADFSADSVYNDIVDWITLESEHGFLAPNSSVKINYTIKVPETAPAGGQYAAITVRNAKDDGAALVNEVIEIASVIYGRVEGEIHDEGTIERMEVPLLVLTPPVISTVGFSNSGNIHNNATVKTKITNFLTGEIIYDGTKEGEYTTETIMPETTRVVNYPYENVPELGILHFSQEVVYGGEQKVLDKNILVCPIWFVILFAVTVCFVIGLVISEVVRVVRKRFFTRCARNFVRLRRAE